MKNKITATTEAELQKILAEKREAVRNFQFGTSGGKTTNVKAARNLKKDIARILTKLQEVRIKN